MLFALNPFVMAWPFIATLFAGIWWAAARKQAPLNQKWVLLLGLLIGWTVAAWGLSITAPPSYTIHFEDHEQDIPDGFLDSPYGMPFQ